MRNAIVVVSAVLLFATSAAAAPICGDVNNSKSLTSSDALQVLKAAVGQPITLQCAPFGQTLVSGQTTCWNPSDTTDPIATTPCAGTGQDGEIQNGVAHSYTDNGNGSLTDNVTGLVWEKLSDDGSVHDVDNTYTWSQAFAKITALNGASFAGHNDWRLPNRFELETLLNLEVLVPSTYPAFNSGCSAGCTVTTCNCTFSDYYWTSSTFKNDPKGAWAVDFYDAFLSAIIKTDTLSARAVRGKS